MVVISVIILLIFFEPPDGFTMAFSTYCSLPCPFMGPTPPPYCLDGDMEPKILRTYPRSPPYVPEKDFTDFGMGSERATRRLLTDKPSSPTTGPPEKPEPISDPDPKPSPSPDPKEWGHPPKKEVPRTASPCPPKKFFTSLFSIPGAVLDTMLGGEVVL